MSSSALTHLHRCEQSYKNHKREEKTTVQAGSTLNPDITPAGAPALTLWKKQCYLVDTEKKVKFSLSLHLQP